MLKTMDYRTSFICPCRKREQLQNIKVIYVHIVLVKGVYAVENIYVFFSRI